MIAPPKYACAACVYEMHLSTQLSTLSRMLPLTGELLNSLSGGVAKNEAIGQEYFWPSSVSNGIYDGNAIGFMLIELL